MARTGQSTGELRPSLFDSAFGHDPFPMALAPLEKPPTGCLSNGRRARRDAELGEDVGDVPVNGVLADEQLLANRLIAQTRAKEPKHLDFALREACIARRGLGR